ncbi:carboxypeptidase regulatory-like domain-containing protein [Candidatus Palauibacter sp.]|uniref:carboxypeptidase regulatory-like domain-containing protein n=1 Tax=Candidatus Palauibacter sp. TaxID=3101350 RepID=UPI003B02654B
MNYGRALAITVLVALQPVVVPVGMGGQSIDDCDDRASLQISVVDESGFIPIPEATVVLRWTDAERRPVRETAGTDGHLLLCAPRDAGEATLWAEFGDASSEESVVALEAGLSHEVELRLLLSETGTGRLVGHVRDAGTDDPVATAAVSIIGDPGEVSSNRRGRFVLSGVPVGRREITVRHIGYAPFRHPVVVARGRTTEVEIGLVPEPLEMEPLVATAVRLRRLETRGFYERKYWGELVSGGTFFTTEDIERRNPTRITHMIADAPGIRLGGCGARLNSCRLYNSRIPDASSSEGCLMSVYLDGSLVVRRSRIGRGSSSNINDFVIPIEIAGVEVYRGPSELPAEFAGMESRCGVVVIWTKS